MEANSTFDDDDIEAGKIKQVQKTIAKSETKSS
jgi:hypothetical protein